MDGVIGGDSRTLEIWFLKRRVFLRGGYSVIDFYHYFSKIFFNSITNSSSSSF